MATGPVTQQEYDEMMDEGLSLYKELKRADAYIEILKEEKIVLEAERDQADKKVLEQDKTIMDLTKQRDDLTDEVKELKESLQEWTDFEGWRQGRWVLVQEELKRLRAELASLKNENAPVVADS